MKYFYILILTVSITACSFDHYWGDTVLKSYIATNKPCTITTFFDTLYVNKLDSLKYESSMDNLVLEVSTPKLSETFIFPAKKPIYDIKYRKPSDSIELTVSEFLEYIQDDNHAIYEYPKELAFEITNSDIRFHSMGLPENRIGEISLLFTIPEGNNFYFNSGGYGKKSVNGFLGFGIGIEYYMKNKYIFHLSAESMTDFAFPFPASYHPENDERIFNNKVSGIIYKDLYWFQAGIGLSYSRFTYNIIETPEVYPNFISYLTHSYSYNSISLPISIKKYISKRIQIGLHYHPSFISINDKWKFEYSHIFYFNFNFIFRLNKHSITDQLQSYHQSE